MPNTKQLDAVAQFMYQLELLLKDFPRPTDSRDTHLYDPRNCESYLSKLTSDEVEDLRNAIHVLVEWREFVATKRTLEKVRDATDKSIQGLMPEKPYPYKPAE